MRRFSEASDMQLTAKVIAMRHSEMGDAMTELAERWIDSQHKDMEKVVGDLSSLTLIQGRIAQLRDLLNLLNPSTISAPQ